MRILLTGATGFLGKFCLPLLRVTENEVHAVARNQIPEAPGVIWHRANLMDPVAGHRLMQDVRPSHWLHLAWTPTLPGAFWHHEDNYRWVGATFSLFEDFVAAGGQRAVFTGTCAEYDWSFGYCSEALTPLQPTTPYGICKHALHLLLDSFARQHKISLAWARLFHLYGPHDYPQRLVAATVLSLLRGSPALCTHGEQIRDFLYAGDAAAALVQLLESDVEGAINIASGKPVALKELLGQIGALLERNDLIKLGAVPPPAGDPPFLAADVRRLHEEAGWKARFGLREGLEHTIDWWRQQENL